MVVYSWSLYEDVPDGGLIFITGFLIVLANYKLILTGGLNLDEPSDILFFCVNGEGSDDDDVCSDIKIPPMFY